MSYQLPPVPHGSCDKIMRGMLGFEKSEKICVQEFFRYKELVEEIKAKRNECLQNTDELEAETSVTVREIKPCSKYVKTEDCKPSFSQYAAKCLEEKNQKSRGSILQRSAYAYMQREQRLLDGDTKQESDWNVLFTVRVYRPRRSTHTGRMLERPVFSEEIECLGSNLLTELRDKITCVCNKHRFIEISENPLAQLPEKTCDPGYFFIQDTFYNDTRLPENVDYSKCVRDWASQARGLVHLHFKTAKMEQTRFNELTISIGYPQLYQHHGNCEHLFVFSQLRLLQPLRIYPSVVAHNVYNQRPCSVCGTRCFIFIVEGSDRLVADPSYLCSSCFFSYHYLNGKKIGQFRAYRIINNLDEEMIQLEEPKVETDTNIDKDMEMQLNLLLESNENDMQ